MNLQSRITAFCRPRLIAVALLSASTGTVAQSVDGRTWIELEGAAIDFRRNTIQKPNDAAGTRFSALDYADDRAPAGRLAIETPITRWGTGHRLRLAYVPLRIEGSGAPGTGIRFQDATFAGGRSTTLEYRFDTWRATYSVPLSGRDDATTGWAWRAGGTLAIRDASIRLSQAGVSQQFDNVGLVPLLHVSVARAFAPGWSFEAEFDGAPGPGGTGLWDGAVRLRRELGASWSVAAGLRHLRGGVDNDELYNIVSATSATVSARYAF